MIMHRRIMQPPIMQLEGISRRYGAAPPVVQDLDLSLHEGEFLTLLGPSGCGKSTTLRMMAGLEQPTAGRIFLRGADITAHPAYRRPVNTVFQDYALFPHLSVRDNVAFGLATAGIPRPEQHRRVAAMLDIVGLSDQARQRPATLSGGQKQRVALARALVREPAVLLLDEPLSALDAQRRTQMQGELKALQARLGITFLLVTHDQTEALSMSDRIALMRDGRILQLDTPEVLYDRPTDGFVAAFLGAANLLLARAAPGGAVLADGAFLAVEGPAPNQAECVLCIRPADVSVAAAPGPNTLAARVRKTVFQGDTVRLDCVVNGSDQTLTADLGRAKNLPEAGQTVTLYLPPPRLRTLPR